ncbi:MAG TPA: nuclear transport factor 2 family protein [Opitutaceae bacterium]|nr:nuclear transport factor 2 family protein [Opitutaceae bacterium]
MKRILGPCFGLAIAGLLAAATPAHAQEWSPAQKEIWQNVEAYWKLGAEKNLDGFLAYFADDYVGWETGSPLPTTKASLRKWLEHDFKVNDTVVYEVKPVAIVIHGDVAFVDYYYSQITRGPDAKEKSESGNWTDILIKQGDKWVLIGDHGGRTSKD